MPHSTKTYIIKKRIHFYMVGHILGLHHHSVRKRIFQKHEKYPNPNKWKRFMDKSIYVVALFGPIMTFPQLSKIWIGKSASGVSVISWSAYLITAVFWLIYGVMHKEKPIIITYIAWIILESFIVLGALIHG